MKANKLILYFVLPLAIILGLWSVLKKRYQPTKNPFITEKPIPRNMVQYITASGNLKAKDQISVGALVAGRVVKILAEDNDIVKKGQVLTILDNGIGDTAVKSAKAKLTEAKARYEFLKNFYNRQKALFLSNQLSRNTFEQVTQDYLVANARVKQIEAELEKEAQIYNNLFIKSPDNGIVIARKINLGQMITSQLDATVLFEIAKDLKDMEAHIDVDEADIGMIKEGQQALFTVDAFPKLRFCAKVDRIQYQAKIIDNVVTYATVLDVKNPDMKLRPGMTTNVDIKAAEKKQAPTIPNKALRVSTLQVEKMGKQFNFTVKKLNQIKGKHFKHIKTKDDIWILEPPATIKQIEIEIGINDGKYSQVLSELDENSLVVVDIEEESQGGKLLKKVFSQPGGLGK